MRGNVIVGQSGGPTAVINSSLAGVYRTAKELGFNKVYGMLHGVRGLLDEKYVDLSEEIQFDLDVELLKRTPSAFLGSCRYKLPEVQAGDQIFERIFSILENLEIECFIYIGGNDSMDTIVKLSDYAALMGYKQKFIGVPKTIDNDLLITDHTPGYASAAKYIGATIKEIIRDCLSLSYDRKNVTVVEIMGRNAGWLAAAASLAKAEDCVGPDLIYFPENVFDVDDFLERVRKLLETKNSLVIAVSEGIKLKDGRYVCELFVNNDYLDPFGHKLLTGTAAYLANRVNQEFGCKARGVELSILQRSASHLASRIDINEAYTVGAAAVKAAAENETGKMVIIKRLADDPYHSETDLYDIHHIANEEKKLPKDWMNEDGTYVTDKYLTYIRPLIQGDYFPFMVDGLPRHLFIH